MKRRALRRHHMWRMKHNRSTDNDNGDGGLRHRGIHYRPPKSYSCWMCANQRKHHGPGIQELRAIANYNED